MTRIGIGILILVNMSLLTAWPVCPSIPSQCDCSFDWPREFVIKCNGVNFTELVEAIGDMKIGRLTISNCSQPIIDVLPRVRLRSLEISDCGIRSVDVKVFRQVRNTLEELVLSNNELTSLPVFGLLPKLTLLNLNGNKVTGVSEGSLNGFPSLRRLELKNNKICAFDGNVFNGTILLEWLDLGGNCLTEVPSMDLEDLKVLRLDNNQLNMVGPMVFKNVRRLEHLILNSNHLTNVDGAVLQDLKDLKFLDISNNMLTKIPILKNLPSLWDVQLAENFIEEIAVKTFSNNSRLGIINLDNNKIAHISKDSFDSLDKMWVLSLENNSLTTLDEGILNGMKNLSGLHLKKNSIMKIDPKALLSVPQLRTIELAYNKLEMIESPTFQHLGKLEHIDLSHNRLRGFEKDTFNKNNRFIYLSGNPLECDEKFEWYITFLVSNKMRVYHHYGEEDVFCSSPVGVRLKDLMEKAKNKSLRGALKIPKPVAE